MSKYQHQCLNCGKIFEDYYKTTKFCSRQCYDYNRSNNGKLKTLQCPICNNLFKQSYSGQQFCSVECRVKSTENKVQCVCDCCGKLFYRIQSEVERSNKHYCSMDCKRSSMYWGIEDTQILKENYGKLSYEQMINMFSVPYTVNEIKRRASYIGITANRQWTKDELNILIEKYSNNPIDEVMNLLPNRSLESIRGQAKLHNLKSYYYLSRKYTDEEVDYLKNNYLSKNNQELAVILNRTEKAIAHYLWSLDLHRPSELGSYKNLYAYVRQRMVPWRDKIKEQNNYTCAITGKRSNIVIHHIYGFNLIFNEAINNLDFQLHTNISEYSQSQLDCLVSEVLSLHEYYGKYICITEDVHNHFHSIYGCGNNTEEQWNEFINTYYKQ